MIGRRTGTRDKGLIEGLCRTSRRANRPAGRRFLPAGGEGLNLGAETLPEIADCCVTEENAWNTRWPHARQPPPRQRALYENTEMPLGEFIEPDRSLEDIANPADKLGIELFSGFRALYTGAIQRGQNRIFDRIIDRQQQQTDLPYEDQCSSQYYFDLVRTLRDFNGQYDRVAEVGVYMGGASAFIAGCMGPFDFDLDLIDLHAPYLQFTHERVRRLYPEAARRIRLFHGDLPSYVRRVVMKETGHNYVVHHDGAHDFNGVVKDMASLFYVKDRIAALIAQDTHLRGTLKYMNFVDLALHAVFGTDMSYAPIGTSYEPGSAMTLPNQYQGNYFIPGAPEGMVLPMSMNTFKYPHPLLKMDDFLPPEA